MRTQFSIPMNLVMCCFVEPYFRSWGHNSARLQEVDERVKWCGPARCEKLSMGERGRAVNARFDTYGSKSQSGIAVQ